MTLSIGTFAKPYSQTKLFKLIYKNENGTVYSIKLPFRKFILLTI